MAFIGAVATPDPTWGQAFLLSLQDVLVLRDSLLADDDWDAAGYAYAREHRRYYKVIHDFELRQTRLLLETGLEAGARR